MQYLNSLKLCAAAAVTLLSGSAFAQGAFPSKPITVIIGLTAGSPSDVETRLYTPKLSGFLGQPILIDYKPGAGTTIAGAYVAKSAPDGYTMMFITSGFTAVPALYKDLTFEPTRDFAPVSMMSEKPLVLMVTQSFPAKNFMEYIAYARANPGKINYGHVGVGSTAHLAGSWMHSATNTTITQVPYKGMPPLLSDMLAGRMDATVALISNSGPLVKAGKMRLIATLGDKRSRLLPDVPTIAEQGIPEYNYTTWSGFLAPAGTPAATVNKISEGFAKVARERDVAATLEGDGAVAVGSTPGEFRQVFVSSAERLRKLIQDNGIKAE